MGKAAVALGVTLIVAGGAALGYALTRKPEVVAKMTPAQSSQMGAAIAQLDGAFEKAHGKAREKATTLASQPIVRNTAQTDRATAEDNVKSKALDFQPVEGEVIELGQTGGGEPLLIMPSGASPTKHGNKIGSYAEPGADNLVMITEVVPVVDGDKTFGYLSVGRSFDLKPFLAKLGEVSNAELTVNGVKIAIGKPLAADAMTETMKLGEPGATLVVEVPKVTSGGMPIPIVGAGAGIAGLGLIVLVIGMLGKKRDGATLAYIPAVSTVEPPPGADGRHTQTKLTGNHAVAAGTPSPVDLAGGYAINPSNLGAGAMIGRWEVIRRLGSGGMADVYLAHSKGEAGFEKLVAIKVMHAHLARNQRAVDHFLDEAKLAARIHHPNVVAIQDLGKIGNDYVIVMEYVEGVDLERLLASARAAQRTVPVEVALGIVCRICDGLHAAHTALGADGTPMGLIHRDVKSANVLVSRQGGVKVVDFGIAKASSQGHLTLAGETKGTPSMMAPEQRVGEQVDVRADVYSVAAVAYEVLTGHGVNLDLAALAHLGVDNWPHLPLPSQMRSNLPVELDDILLTAMSFDRERRPTDCAAFEAQFEAVMKTYGLSASDKDIARWIDSELRALVPAFEGVASTLSKPAGMS
ncbi:MAG: serine/threonine protein kinase [Deltaproteobacteria bacterium]|nr:serine/threonine protein kinase [Deltaproteobacteria bacterium]